MADSNRRRGPGAGSSARKPRILIVGAFPPPTSDVLGGVVTVCRNLIESSFSDRFELVLVDTTQRSNPPPILLARALFSIGRGVTYSIQLMSSRPEAVILFCSAGASLVEKSGMARLARLIGIPAFIFPQGGKVMEMAATSKIHRLWIRWALRGGTYFLCQGPTWRRFAIETIGFDASHAAIIPNWTVTERLLAIGRGRSPSVSDQDVQFLFLGWLETEKGVFELLQAFSDLADRYRFRLVLAGKGRAEEDARAVVDGSALSDQVEFAGWVRGDDLESLLASSDVLVLPSWSEGLPNAMLEAMAARLAVIVSAVGNVPDVVTDGREALLVQPRNVDALRAAIRRLLDDRALRDSIAVRGHDFVKQQYAVEPAVEILSGVIDSVVG